MKNLSKHNCQKKFDGKNYYCPKNLDGKNHYHRRILTNHKKVGSSRISFSLFINTILNFGQECLLPLHLDSKNKLLNVYLMEQ